MSRPEVTVVMPFAGSPVAGREALAALGSLQTRDGDELILVDNSVSVAAPDGGANAVTVISADAERSPAHARNAGAARATGEWILFIDSDCAPRGDLLDRYFDEPVAGDVGALVGEVHAAPDAQTLAGRYGAARGFLSQRAHLEHPYRPRAAAANVIVRRAAFEAVGGFYEGVRAAEDTDFSWRLQQAGWRLELRPDAYVQHRYRDSLGDLRRQWRGYAAGRAWLSRRYDGFEPEPGLKRGWRRVTRRGAGRRSQRSGAPGASPSPGRIDRGAFAAIDALLSVEELAGFALSNRPSGGGRSSSTRPEVVLLADRFPARGDPLVELARTLEGVRVEALRRPDAFDVELARALAVDYVEDDGAVARLLAAGMLAARHPLRSGFDLARRRPGDPRLRELAPAVRRLEHDRRARVQALGSGSSVRFAERLARLAGRKLGG